MKDSEDLPAIRNDFLFHLHSSVSGSWRQKAMKNGKTGKDNRNKHIIGLRPEAWCVWKTKKQNISLVSHLWSAESLKTTNLETPERNEIKDKIEDLGKEKESIVVGFFVCRFLIRSNFIKTTYDISLDSQISFLPFGFSPTLSSTRESKERNQRIEIKRKRRTGSFSRFVPGFLWFQNLWKTTVSAPRLLLSWA